jgi:hypothetical protein
MVWTGVAKISHGDITPHGQDTIATISRGKQQTWKKEAGLGILVSTMKDVGTLKWNHKVSFLSMIREIS